MNKKLVIGVLVGLLALTGLVVFLTKDEVKPLGVNSGPQSDFPSFTVNGLEIFYNRIPLRQATTTVCAIKSPTATSTLIFGSITMTTSTTSASVIDLAKATTPYATTTRLNAKYSLGAGKQATITASTTDSTVALSAIFAPNTYFVVNMVGGAGKAVSPVGTCVANFLVN